MNFTRFASALGQAAVLVVAATFSPAPIHLIAAVLVALIAEMASAPVCD